MRTYYINNGNENGGPFTIDELKNQPLYKTTLVWYQGMDEWKYASEISDLDSFFTVLPPPIKRITAQPTVHKKEKSTTIWGLKKSYFFLALAFTLVMSFVLVLTIIQNNKRAELDAKNKQTEFSNEQIELQQKEYNEQQIQNEIQKRIASENNNKRRKDSITNRLTEIKNLIVEDKYQLSQSKNALADAENFKLLRSESTKDEQIMALQNDIQNWIKEIDQLENESNRLYLELETIH